MISILRPESFSLSSFYTLIGVKFESCRSLLLVTACAWVSHHVLSVFLCLLLPPSVLFSVWYMLKKMCVPLTLVLAFLSCHPSFLYPYIQEGFSGAHRVPDNMLISVDTVSDTISSSTFFLAEKVRNSCRQMRQSSML